MQTRLKVLMLAGGILTLLAAVGSLTQTLLESEIPEEQAAYDVGRPTPTPAPKPAVTIAKKAIPPPKEPVSDISLPAPPRAKEPFKMHESLPNVSGTITNALEYVQIQGPALEKEEEKEEEPGQALSRFGVIYKPSPEEEGGEGKTIPSLIPSPVECPSGL